MLLIMQRGFAIEISDMPWRLKITRFDVAAPVCYRGCGLIKSSYIY